jgi:hypothetical protein
MSEASEKARAAAIRRAAMAMLRGAGQGDVTLKIPAPAAGGDDAEQLGLATPQFSDLPLTNVLVKSGADGRPSQVIVGAEILQEALQLQEPDKVVKAVRDAGGVVVGETWLAIEDAEAVSFFGVPCLYRIDVRTSGEG